MRFRRHEFTRRGGLGVLVLLGTGTLISSLIPVPALATPRAQLVAYYGKLPLHFERNRGQADARVKYLARGLGYGLFLTADGAVLRLHRRVTTNPAASGTKPSAAPAGAPPAGTEDAVLRVRLIGANHAPEIRGEELLPGRSNYFIGNDKSEWRTGIAQYARVRYREIYPGVDLAYYGNQRRLEYDFIVAPGANPDRIRWTYSGADRLSVDQHGDLHIAVAGSELVQHRPEIYQSMNGRKTAVDGGFRLIHREAGTEVAFTLGSYDHRQPLIIDPVLVYSTYLGGSADFEAANAIAVDGNGNAYVAGFTASTDFPTAHALQPTYAGGVSGSFGDAFVAKLSADGRSLIYSTYIGGSRGDVARAIAVDASGDAYIVGDTASDNFPTANALQANRKVGSDEFAPDAFVAKLNADGSALVYSTYLGGSGTESGNAIAVDGGGDVYVAGNTNSTDFPTVNPFQPKLKTGPSASHTLDGFIAKLDAGGSALVYSTYFGGSDLDGISGIAVDRSGDAYVAGSTFSSDFPTVNALQASKPASPRSPFVAEFDAAGSALIYSTYLDGSNGSQFDGADGIAVDGGGNAYVVGETSATDFPTTAKAFQRRNAGKSDAFISKLSAGGSALVYSTYLGSSGEDGVEAIAVDPGGNAYVVGVTASGDFPTVNPLQAKLAGNGDFFIAELDAAGSGLIFSTFLGGSGPDGANAAIAVDPGGNIYIAGRTDSSDFPTAHPVQANKAGGNDAFIAKINPSGSGGGGNSGGSGGGSVGWLSLAGLLGLATLRAVRRRFARGARLQRGDHLIGGK